MGGKEKFLYYRRGGKRERRTRCGKGSLLFPSQGEKRHVVGCCCLGGREEKRATQRRVHWRVQEKEKGERKRIAKEKVQRGRPS